MSTDKERIAAMLALANHPNTPRHEAENALALASRLMLRNGWTEDDFPGQEDAVDESIVTETIGLPGTYARQRLGILYAIARIHSCVGYMDRDDTDQPVVVLYGRRNDIFAARTLFAAADLMGQRLLPRGDRSWRVSWWKGFRQGIEEVLGAARKDYVKESPGAGLVLADRSTRAEKELRTYGPPLRNVYSYATGSASSFANGVSAGRSFGAAGRSFGPGVRGELG